MIKFPETRKNMVPCSMPLLNPCLDFIQFFCVAKVCLMNIVKYYYRCGAHILLKFFNYFSVFLTNNLISYNTS